MQKLYQEIIASLKQKKLSQAEIASLKMRLCGKYRAASIPTNIQVLLHAEPDDLKKVRILTKPIRTISGVAVVTIMTAPIPCRHGKCTYCPGGPGSYFGSVPQSYTGNEPASLRAIRADYDPYLQVFNRLEQYAVMGHDFEKIELIINGGTFTSMPLVYQKEFVAYALKALNDFSDYFFSNGFLDIIKFKKFFELPGNFKDAGRVRRVKEKIIELKTNSNLENEKLRNETAKSRCVALCIETKPDYSNEEEISNMLSYGATRVELGIQTLHDEILKKVNRGHSLKESIEATKLLKDSFLKACYHIMPGLPLSTNETDVNVFKELFSNPDYRPDALKIYPVMVMKGTALYEDWKRRQYAPLTTTAASEIIAEAKKYIPEYCRVMRVQRDIPTKITAAGVDRTNLRQYVEKLLKQKNIVCRCIRCREPKESNIDFDNVRIKKINYESSGGEDVFMAAEDVKNDLILGFCRLRMPSKPFRKEITKRTAGVRELHVYGRATALTRKGKIQHRGIGKKLLALAEEEASGKYDCNKLLVMSGIGAREYYKKLGYKQDGPYMGKWLIIQ